MILLPFGTRRHSTTSDFRELGGEGLGLASLDNERFYEILLWDE